MKKKKDVIRCPRCNAEIASSDEFCLQCGKLLLLDDDYDVIADEEELF